MFVVFHTKLHLTVFLLVKYSNLLFRVELFYTTVFVNETQTASWDCLIFWLARGPLYLQITFNALNWVSKVNADYLCSYNKSRQFSLDSQPSGAKLKPIQTKSPMFSHLHLRQIVHFLLKILIAFLWYFFLITISCKLWQLNQHSIKNYLTLYTTKSVCIFSLLLSTQFLWGADKQLRACLVQCSPFQAVTGNIYHL